MSIGVADRDKFKRFLESADYFNTAKLMSYHLRNNVIDALGGKWKALRRDYGIYTVTSRPKEIDRALEKYDRFVADGLPINSENFFEFMPDLAAARVVVVDPADLFRVAETIRCKCGLPQFTEPGEAFPSPRRLRTGKFSMYQGELVREFESAGYTIARENAGYCSVHFVFRCGPQFFARTSPDEAECLTRLQENGNCPLTNWHVEVQVRTLMEEAWAETDHFVRYVDPDLREDRAVVSHFAALSGYLQAANYHVSLIREIAKDHKA